MDPSLINEASFSAANPSSYSLAGIWPFPSINGGGGGGLVEESTVTEYSEGGNGRKRRDLSSEDEGAMLVSSATSSGGSVGGANNDLNDSPGKRVKVPGCNNGSSDPEVAVDGGSSAGNKKPFQQSTKPSEPPKDYIHVRARRGQATDSHSLAERARREKISERMKILQDLVPGCNKVIGKALVLDEIINYIQSLQRQVEFLSMKLEAVSSRMNIHPTIEGFYSKDIGAQTFDMTGIMFSPPSTREYSQGPQPEWLHMQVGGSFERAS